MRRERDFSGVWGVDSREERLVNTTTQEYGSIVNDYGEPLSGSTRSNIHSVSSDCRDLLKRVSPDTTRVDDDGCVEFEPLGTRNTCDNGTVSPDEIVRPATPYRKMHVRQCIFEKTLNALRKPAEPGPLSTVKQDADSGVRNLLSPESNLSRNCIRQTNVATLPPKTGERAGAP